MVTQWLVHILTINQEQINVNWFSGIDTDTTCWLHIGDFATVIGNLIINDACLPQWVI